MHRSDRPRQLLGLVSHLARQTGRHAGQAALATVGWVTALAFVFAGCGERSGSASYDHTYASAGNQDDSPATQVAGGDAGASTPPAAGAAGGTTPVAPFSSVALVALDLTSSDAVSASSSPGATLLAGLDPTLCVNVPNGQADDGATPTLDHCGNHAAQSWALAGGRLTIGSGKCLGLADAAGGSAAPRLAPCYSGADTDAEAALQIWRLTGGMLRNDAAKTCLTGAGTPLAANTKLAMFPCDANNSLQKWGLGNNATNAGGSNIVIGARWGWLSDTTYCMDTVSGATDGNVVVRQWPCNTYDAQRWVLRAGQMLHQNRCLTAAGGQTHAAIDTRVCADSPAAAGQAWDYDRGALHLVGTDQCACVTGDPASRLQLVLQPCEVAGSVQAACQWAPGRP